jgi:hydroxypyruvate reductase
MQVDSLIRTLKEHLPDPGMAEKISQVILSSLKAVDPYTCVRTALNASGGVNAVGGVDLHLYGGQRLFVISLGKAAIPMASAVSEHFGERIHKGVIVPKHLNQDEKANLPLHFEFIQGGHPVPNSGSLAAGKAILDVLQETTAEDLVLFTVSGGGSALVTAPWEPISLEELQTLTAALLKSGACIEEINTIRKHLDRVKGGGLARAAYPARVLTLLLSDVVGDPLDMIASGPTVPDPTGYGDALKILEAYHLQEIIPASIMDHLQKGFSGAIPETPKKADPIFDRTATIVIGSNRRAAQAALQAVQALGFDGRILTTSLQGEARDVGRYLGSTLQQLDHAQESEGHPVCLMAGGETTVHVVGDGLGGRNLEVALAGALEIDGLENVALITLATDGEDGPTNAAGAIVTGDTLRKARELGFKPELYLENNDSYHFFKAVGGLIRLGPTGTNVNDLMFLFRF